MTCDGTVVFEIEFEGEITRVAALVAYDLNEMNAYYTMTSRDLWTDSDGLQFFDSRFEVMGAPLERSVAHNTMLEFILLYCSYSYN